jgi:hypothetical protein
MVPVHTLEEYEEAMHDELSSLDDTSDTIEDIAKNIEDKDEDVLCYEEVRALRKIIQDINDTVFNLEKLIKDYTANLTEAVPESK